MSECDDEKLKSEKSVVVTPTGTDWPSCDRGKRYPPPANHVDVK